MKKRIVEVVMTVVLLVCILVLSKEAAEVLRANEQEQVIVVDPGHGGMDPGVVGIGDVEEKNINLLIAMKLRSCLEEAGFEVVMTRDKDEGLYDETSSRKKVQDMQRRVEFINQTNPILTVSVHQNSFPDESVCGPQVFYYENSEEGSQLADAIQNVLNTKMEVTKPREKKANGSYYLLKHSPAATAIVECGFLTNPAEAELLQNEEYQQKVAECITEGVLLYLEEKQ